MSRLQSLLDDMHLSFKDTVRVARGHRISKEEEPDIFSGRAWTGRQALQLGLVDGIDDMRTVMRRRFGPKV